MHRGRISDPAPMHVPQDVTYDTPNRSRDPENVG